MACPVTVSAILGEPSTPADRRPCVIDSLALEANHRERTPTFSEQIIALQTLLQMAAQRGILRPEVWEYPRPKSSCARSNKASRILSLGRSEPSAPRSPSEHLARGPQRTKRYSRRSWIKGGTTFDVVDLLAYLTPTPAALSRPFPLKSRWKQPVPKDCFGDHLLTQAEPEHFNRNVTLPEIPPGASPLDGLHWLWDELQYCDTWSIGYALVFHGEARGQVWAYCSKIWPTRYMLLKPVAGSFIEWYSRWLQELLSTR